MLLLITKCYNGNDIREIFLQSHNKVMYTQSLLTMISGFRRDVDVICGLLGDYTA
jgi:hypothetical protein